ncbi:hypothetical protein ID866_3979 [Astraeus odoratus]|nr:hypothetical protein ID866_3979 [Astraeus odoratus]
MSSERERFVVRNPATNEEIFLVEPPTSEEVDDAVKAAHRAYESDAQVPDIAQLETLQTGRAIREMNAQIGRLPDWLFVTFYGYMAAGFVAPTQGKLLNYVHRVPLGVVVQITPFNHPLFIAVKKIAPALAAGNSVIVKPSELAPISLLEFVKLASDAGIPDGVLTVLPGYGHSTGTQLASHSLVRKVDITAGTRTGRAIGAMVGSNLAAFTAELGGKAPIVVFRDADLISAVNGVAFASFIASGQTCVSGTRILVQEGIYDEFMDSFLEKAQSITRRMGDRKLHPLTVRNKLLNMQPSAKSHVFYGDCHIGTASYSHSPDGAEPEEWGNAYWRRTDVRIDVDVHDEIWQEEIFGPVVVVKKFKEEAEGIALANLSKYGLGAGVWTTDLSRAHRVANEIQAGLVWINTHHRNDPSSPWGGMKESGIGRENGIEALEAYSQSKSIIVNTATAEESRIQDDWFVGTGDEMRYG